MKYPRMKGESNNYRTFYFFETKTLDEVFIIVMDFLPYAQNLLSRLESKQ